VESYQAVIAPFCLMINWYVDDFGVQSCYVKEQTKLPHRSIALAARLSAVIQYLTLVRSVSYGTGGLAYVPLNVALGDP
jgi:hypothetical protein